MENVLSMKSMTKESTSSYFPNILENLLSSSFKNMKEENDINKLLESKFYCSRKFSEEIETLVKDNNDMKYIDAIVFFCEKNNIDIETVPKLISKPLKEKIKCEAMDLNFLKRTSHAKLPL